MRWLLWCVLQRYIRKIQINLIWGAYQEGSPANQPNQMQCMQNEHSGTLESGATFSVYYPKEEHTPESSPRLQRRLPPCAPGHCLGALEMLQ